MEFQRDEAEVVFLLTGEERLALVRILRVVEDNWWLDEVERALLVRLDLPNAVAARSAAA